MALDLKIALYTDDTCKNLYMVDATGSYMSANTGGYGSPNPASSTFDSASVVLNIFGTTLTYAFTLVNNVITAATATLSGGTPINILSKLTATSWPFDYNNPLNLTPLFYSVTLPALEDQVYEVKYSITDDGLGSTYTTTDSYLIECATCCCISKQLAGVNINDTTKLVANLVPIAFLEVARYADSAGNITKANQFITKASAVCNDSSGCGC